MVLVVDAQQADAVKATLEEAGETVFEVGTVVPGTGVVRYENEGSLFAAKEEE
jgi:phosphoribosylformylglycinamidine cyclo-ligase